MDRIINIKVSGHYLTKDNKNAGVQGEANASTMRITFDESWIQTSKKVTFWNALGENPVVRNLTANYLEGMVGSDSIYRIPIPGEAMTEHGWFEFVIDGYVDGVRMRSLQDKLYVHPAKSTDNASEPINPTPSQLEQMQQQIEELLGKINDAIEAGKTAEEILELIRNDDTWAKVAKSWAVGGSGMREGEDYDNSKYYCEVAKNITMNPVTFVDNTTGYLYKMGVDNGNLYIEKVAEGLTPGDGVAYMGLTPTAGVTPTPPVPSVGTISPVFIVEFSEIDGVWAADKTIEEVKAAIVSDYVLICEVVGEHARSRGRLMICRDDSITFVVHNENASDEYYTMLNGALVTRVVSTRDVAQLLQELITYITENGDSETVQQFFEEIVEGFVEYITINGDNETVQKFFEEVSQEFVEYITNNGDNETVKKFFEDITQEFIEYVTNNGDSETVQKFFEELADQTVQYITENGDTINLGASVFTVTFTESDGTYTADKKFSEVMAEIENGNVVVAEFGSSTNKGILQLNGYGSGLIEFVYHSYWGADSYLCLKSDETVDYVTQSVVADDDMPSSVRVTKDGDTVTVTASKGWKESVTTIVLDEDGYPKAVSRDGKDCALTWEGFD